MNDVFFKFDKIIKNNSFEEEFRFNFKKYLLITLFLHFFLLFIFISINKILSNFNIDFSSSSLNLVRKERIIKIKQSVKVDLVAMPRRTLLELKKISMVKSGSNIKTLQSEKSINTKSENLNDFKVKDKKINLKKLLTGFSKDKKVKKLIRN
jgi:hypothetical protein